MKFSLIAIEIKDALRQPDCPVCRVDRQAAYRYIYRLLWDSVNDLDTRKWILDSLGYCPEHTRLLATTELSEYGDVLGTNMIYESLLQALIQRLQAWQPPRSHPRRILESIVQATGRIDRPRRSTAVLTTKATCRVCQVAGESSMRALSVLVDELNSPANDWHQLYRDSDGLCLAHLQVCLEQFSSEFPEGVEFLQQNALQRASRWLRDIREYIRKHNWNSRHEAITDEENLAWQQTLAFFTSDAVQTYAAINKRDIKR